MARGTQIECRHHDGIMSGCGPRYSWLCVLSIWHLFIIYPYSILYLLKRITYNAQDWTGELPLWFFHDLLGLAVLNGQTNCVFLTFLRHCIITKHTRHSQ